MPDFLGAQESTEDELCIERGTVSLADDDTFDTEITEPLSVFLQPETDAALNFCNASNISGTTVTANIYDDTGAAVTGAISVRYLALGYK